MKTNTKKNFLKLATLAFVLFFSVNAVNSQILTDYDEVVETVYQTVGKDFRLYVLPDIVYSPGYDASDNTGLGAAARWTWGWTVDAVVGPGKAAANENWVEISNPAIGTYEFTVVESNTAFACEDAGTTKTVEVIDVPYASINVSAASNIMGLTNVLQSNCASVTTAINALFSNADEVYPYNINLGYTVYNATLDGSGEIVLGAVVATPDVTLSYSAAAPLVVTAGTELVPSTTFGLEGGILTVYEFELRGWNAQISRKSDYLGILPANRGNHDSYTYYNTPNTGESLTAYLIVLPEPVTGPIYHIPNNFNAL